MTRTEASILIKHIERVCEAVGEALSDEQRIAMLSVVSLYTDAPESSE